MLEKGKSTLKIHDVSFVTSTWSNLFFSNVINLDTRFIKFEMKPVICIIGGSGFYEMEEFQNIYRLC